MFTFLYPKPHIVECTVLLGLRKKVKTLQKSSWCSVLQRKKRTKKQDEQADWCGFKVNR